MPAMVDKRLVDKKVDAGARKPASKERSKVDMERLEADYRAGVMTMREIGALHGISGQAVHKHAKVNKWARDLTERVRQTAAAKLATQAQHQAKMPAAEAAAVEASAQAITNVVLGHRTDIARARRLAMSLLGELEEQGQRLDPAMFDRMLSAAGLSGQDAANLRKRIESSLALGNRVSTLQQLVTVLGRAIELERAAFGVAMPGSDPPPPAPADAFPPLDEFRAKLAAVLNRKEE